MVETTKRLFHYVADKVGDGIDVTKSTVLFPITVSQGALELFRAARETRQITSHERKELSSALFELQTLLNSGHPEINVRVPFENMVEYSITLGEGEKLNFYYLKLGGYGYRVIIQYKKINEHGKEIDFIPWGPYHINQRFQTIRILKHVLRHENAREVEQEELQRLYDLLFELKKNVFGFDSE